MTDTTTHAPPPGAAESPYVPRIAELAVVEALTEREKYYRVRLRGGGRFDYLPGQFVQVWLYGYGEVPISICSSPTRVADGFEMCVRQVGRVTGALHRLQADQNGRLTDCNCIIPTAQNYANIEADMRELVPRILDRSQDEITLMLEELVRAYDPCISCSTHLLNVRFV